MAIDHMIAHMAWTTDANTVMIRNHLTSWHRRLPAEVNSLSKSELQELHRDLHSGPLAMRP